jgi:outer membrane protein TolC
MALLLEGILRSSFFRFILILVTALWFAPAVLLAEAVNWNDPHSVARAASDANPSLAGLKYQIAAAREGVGPAGSLPNPMVMGGVQNQQADLSIDHMMTMYMVGASQTLTRKSKRDARRTEAELEVQRVEREYDSQRAEVERDALFAYYDAAAAQSQSAATAEIVAVAKQATSAARFRYEAGTAPQADIIRAMLEEKNLEHDLLALDSRRRQALAKLAALLNVPVSEIPKFTLTHAAQHGHGTFDASLDLASPAFAALQTEVEQAEQEIKLARLALKPDVNLEASYAVRPYQKDMISVVGRIELPYRRKTLIEPRIREAIARRDAARQQIEILKLRLRQDIGVAAASREEAIDQIRLHEDELVPAAKLGFESALASYQTGKETFESVLASLRAYVNLNVDYFEFLKQELQAETDIAALRSGARAGISGGSMGAAPTGTRSMTATSTSTSMQMR